MLESETDVGVGCGIWKRDSVGVSKDIAESPTAERSGDGTPKERRLQVNKTTRLQVVGVMWFSQKKIVNIRVVSWMEDLRISGI